MKYIGWCIAFVSFAFGFCVMTLNKNQERELRIQVEYIEILEEEIRDLEEKQKQITWLEEELENIDNYIRAIECLKIKGAESLPESVEENLRKKLNENRLEVVKNAVYWDRELNKREEEK